MNDEQIIDLFLSRSEKAIYEAKEKYEKYCYNIAYNVLHNSEDSEECVNDTYLQAWNTIPPQKPNFLASFLGKITRNLAINKYKYNTAEKRRIGRMDVILDELEECLPAKDNIEQKVEDKIAIESLNVFLSMQKSRTRKIFIRRYWYMDSIKEIANDFNMSESNVKMTLSRTRSDLKMFMEKEGVSI